jgi:hypothetical protein
MSLLDDFAKGFVVYIGVLSVLAMIGLVSAGQAVTALLLFVVLLIPLSIVTLEYYRSRAKR